MKKNKIEYLIYIRKSKETSNTAKSVSLVDQFNRIKSKLKNEFDYRLLDEIDSSILEEIELYKGKLGKDKENVLNKLHKYGLFIENRSAFKAGKRDQFDAMVEFSKKHKFKGFVIWKASRLARNREDAQRILNFAYDKAERYKFICLDKEYPQTISGKVQLEKDLTDAHKESLEKSRDGKFNYDTTYKVSQKLPNKLPYGYKRADIYKVYKIEIDEKAAQNIRLIYDLFLTKTCTKKQEVAEYLNNQGKQKVRYKTLKDKNGTVIGTKEVYSNFTEKDIELILNNGLYGGYRKVKYRDLTNEEKKEFELRYFDKNIDFNKKEIQIDYSDSLRNMNGYYPILLEDKNDNWDKARKIYDKVQEIRKATLTFRQKKGLKNKGKNFYVYKTQNVRCKYCGHGITGEKKSGNKRDTYRCTHLGADKCEGKNKYIGEKILEKQVKDNIFSKIDENNFIILEKYIDIALKNLGLYKENHIENKKKDLIKIQKQIDTLDNNIEKATLEENIDFGIINILSSQKKKKEEELDSLNKEIGLDITTSNNNDIIDIKEVLRRLKKISLNHKGLNERQKSLVFSNFIDDIKFDGVKKTLDWENVRLSHLVRIITTNVQYFTKFFNKKPKGHGTGKNGIIKASPDDDARLFPYGKECRNGTYAFWFRRPDTLRIKLTPYVCKAILLKKNLKSNCF